jgi:hypothetical protein
MQDLVPVEGERGGQHPAVADRCKLGHLGTRPAVQTTYLGVDTVVPVPFASTES